MRFPTSMTTCLSNQRGISLIAVGLWITALFALTAVGIDVGRIAYTASEVQSAADVAALTGARAIIDGANPQTAADTLLGSGGASPNIINGTSAYSGSSSRVVEQGTVTNAGVFTAGTGPTATAARATIVATVNNLFTGIFGGGNGSTTITKVAIAGFATIGSQRAEVPLAISGSCFDGFNCTAGNCPSLSTFSNNAGWTGYSARSASQVGSYLPRVCRGGGATPPLVQVGDSIEGSNGTQTVNFQSFNCMVCEQGMTEFLVPVVNKPCTTTFNGSFTVTGFATVVVDVATYCNPSHDQRIIPLLAVRRAGTPGNVGGCATCGTGQIRIVG